MSNPRRCPRSTFVLLLAGPVLLLVFSAMVPRQTSGAIETSPADPSPSELMQRFQNPPDDSRIMMRWWWFGPAVTKPVLEREMKLMREGGIGGFEVQPVYPLALDNAGAGIKTLPFLSDEFVDALRFTSNKAREMGLRLDLTIGSGWPYGGPQVSIDQAAARLRVEKVKVNDNSRRVKLPAIGIGEKLITTFVARIKDQSLDPATLRQIPETSDGAVQLPAGLEGPSEVQFFISSRTGQQVKRPAVGAEGFVLDHYDAAALDNYLKQVGDRLMQAFGDRPPHAIFCDSLEVYNADWTGDFLDEFRKRRGYDLTTHLPALVNDFGTTTSAVRHDWGQTLTELLNERFLKPMREWSRRNRTLFRIQDYGVPAAVLSSNEYADLSEGEGPQWKTLSATRWASSASHIYGQPVTSSETWTWLHSPSFRATPLDVKAEADLHFLQGINQLIGHGWPYTAEGVEYPGWRFYAAGVFNANNPWWIVMPDLSRYLQRLSFLLRQGRPANDVAIYLPNDDAWARFTNGNVNTIEALRERLGPNLIPAVLEAGYGFDFIDGDSFKNLARVENGVLTVAQSRFKVVILPNVERIPLDVIEKLEAFAKGGGIVIATRRTPAEAPGLRATPADRQKIIDASQRLFGSPPSGSHFVENETTALGDTLNRLLQPDVSVSSATRDLGFIHRKSDDGEIFFLVNTTNAPLRSRATFRVEGMDAQWWDPMTGAARPALIGERGQGKTTIELSLEPYESRVLVFSRATQPSAAAVAASPQKASDSIDISADWQVSFAGRSAKSRLSVPRSWTEDENTRYYSGVATYEKAVDIPQGFLRPGSHVRLDFGESNQLPPLDPRARGMRALLEGPVREAAVIVVNGRRAGSVWCPPWSIDITDFLKPGRNELQIAVGNTAINYMAGHALPDYKLLNLRYGERFQAQDMDKVAPVPSGLTGVIRLLSER